MKRSVVTVANLKKDFKGINEDIHAVDDISFDIYKEEFVAFIGLNGAGKTTTLKCLTGLLIPTSGKVSVLGYDPAKRKEEFLKKIGMVMGNKTQLWWELPAIETFQLNKEIYEINDGKYNEILDELTNLLDIKGILQVPVRKLSLGERMKCELVASLIHTPELLFLDEPTLGLDIVSAQSLRDFLREYNKRYKATILLTSHNMQDISDLCRRVIIIDKGRLVYNGKISDLTTNFVKTKDILFTLQEPATQKEIFEIGHVVKFTGVSGILSVPRNRIASTSSKLLSKFKVSDLNIQEPSLEYVVSDIFRGKYRE
jgi:ABC-2 type transport system ATP-binding protein